MSLVLHDCYKNMLKWSRKNGVIKATPKRKLSQVAHKVILKAFKSVGGKFVNNNGKQYFELVLRPRVESNTSISQAFYEIQEEGMFR